MKEEVAAAVVFLTRLVKRNKQLTKEKCEKFSDKLTDILVERFKNHWHPDKPLRGQAYRCIRINEFEPTDSVLQQAAKESGLNFDQLGLPSELTLWVDPMEVCCRIGENKGSCITVASFKKEKIENQALTLNVEDMIEDYNKKKSDEMTKLREFTGKRSPVNTPPNSGMIFNSKINSYSFNGQHQTSNKWNKFYQNHYNNLNNRTRPFYNGPVTRNDCVFYHHPMSVYDEDIIMETNNSGESVISTGFPVTTSAPVLTNTPPSMKTGHNHGVSKGDRYRWVKGSEPVQA